MAHARLTLLFFAYMEYHNGLRRQGVFVLFFFHLRLPYLPLTAFEETVTWSQAVLLIKRLG